MKLEIADLIEAIDEATETVEVKVESKDYYSRPGDLSTGYIDVINPGKLKAALLGLIDR